MLRATRIRSAGVFAVLLLAPAAITAQTPAPPWSVLERPRTHRPSRTSPDISMADLMSRLYLFADDSMGGRVLDSPGNALGVEYLAAEMRRLGLEPAGDSGSYFQAVPVFNRVYDPASTLAIGDTSFQPWVDFVPRDQGAGTRSIDGVPVVFGGTWGEPASLISTEAAAGKLVVLALGPAGYFAAPGAVARSEVVRRFERAAGIAVASFDRFTESTLADFRLPGQEFRSNEPAPAPAFLYISNRMASALLGGAVDSAAGGTVGRSMRGSPRFVDRPLNHPARNVVAILRGDDPALRGQYVAIGAHNDHLGTRPTPQTHDSIYIRNHLFRPGGADDPVPFLTPEQTARLNREIAEVRRRTGGQSARPDSIYNGADDDGSGSVSVLEIAEWFAGSRFRPKRSLLFVWHVGEEEGLYGSEYFTDHPTVPRDSVVAQLNIDMIGRGSAADVTGERKGGGRLHGDVDYLQLIGSRRLSSELGDLADAVNQAGAHHLHFDDAMDANGHPQEIYCRSDHYSYARYGIPIIFFTTGGHADYHAVTDEPQYIDYSKLTRVSRFIADLALRVANLDHRVVLDQPKPDPHGVCRQ